MGVKLLEGSLLTAHVRGYFAEAGDIVLSHLVLGHVKASKLGGPYITTQVYPAFFQSKDTREQSKTINQLDLMGRDVNAPVPVVWYSWHFSIGREDHTPLASSVAFNRSYVVILLLG